jgi:hypothetical protein
MIAHELSSAAKGKSFTLRANERPPVDGAVAVVFANHLALN